MMARPTPRKSQLAGSVVAPPETTPTDERHRDEPAPEPTPPAAEDKKPAAAESGRAAKRPRSEPAGTNRLGIYFYSGDEVEETRAAYLADWQNGGDADTFGRWIEAAINTHADRTPAERKQLERRETHTGTNSGTRTFNVSQAALARLRQSVIDDQAAGRWLSDSAWAGEALAAARAAARARNGGTLPTPPARLPNRLKR